MIDLKAIAARTAIAGVLGIAALGIGSGVANAAPPSPVGPDSSWAQDPGWGHGHGGGHGWNNGPGWGPPPPPAYDYGGYGHGGGCVTGPLGFLHFGNC